MRPTVCHADLTIIAYNKCCGPLSYFSFIAKYFEQRTPQLHKHLFRHTLQMFCRYTAYVVTLIVNVCLFSLMLFSLSRRCVKFAPESVDLSMFPLCADVYVVQLWHVVTWHQQGSVIA